MFLSRLEIPTWYTGKIGCKKVCLQSGCIALGRKNGRASARIYKYYDGDDRQTLYQNSIVLLTQSINGLVKDVDEID